ncbi:MAG TPA: hypothetical protein EYQ50_15480 [Verrucomicrobiales bacterium]|nr:hypothetical protein [Verrucomicrobiales bacterium]
MNLVAENPKELLVTYRNLHSQAWRYPHSLGEHLDVLTQKTPNPVLVVPHPEAEYASDHALSNTDRVMAVTDHLSEDQSLVNYAVSMTQTGGKLYLMHIEDQKNFDRIIDSISKIPSIDTEDARTAISEQLLKGPRDFTNSCREHLATSEIQIELEGIVEFGHFLKAYQSRIDSLEIDLLVINTKEDDQLAMHGLAYPLAVELRQIPILMI